MTTREEFEARRLEVLHGAGCDIEPLHLKDEAEREIYALECGAGEPVIFLHGGLSQAGEWGPLIPHLGNDSRLIFVDRPGCGLTYPIDYTGVDYQKHAAEFVGSVLDALGVQRAHLVGNSMGGFFCLAFALRSPERVESLGLVGAPAGVSKWIPLPIRLMGQPLIGGLMNRAIKTPEDLRDKVFDGLIVKDAARVSTEHLELGVMAGHLPGAARAGRTMLHNAVSVRGWRRPIRDRVAKLGVRTRFVWGSHDAFESVKSGRQLAAEMANADFVEIPEAGHLPWHDQPELCARPLRDLWQSTRLEEQPELDGANA